MTAFAFLISGTICGATRIITRDSFSPELAIQLIEKYKVVIDLLKLIIILQNRTK